LQKQLSPGKAQPSLSMLHTAEPMLPLSEVKGRPERCSRSIPLIVGSLNATQRATTLPSPCITTRPARLALWACAPRAGMNDE
jgi:hypothetical protein